MSSSSGSGSFPPLPPPPSSPRGGALQLLSWLIGVAALANSSMAVFVHQPTGSITLVEGSLDVESLLRELPAAVCKEGPSPASRAEIESLPRVRVSEPALECLICLADYYQSNGGEEAKVMPCGHKFHSGCIDKWLGIHASCPHCRLGLPAADERPEWRIYVLLARERTGADPERDVGTDSGPDEDEHEHEQEQGELELGSDG